MNNQVFFCYGSIFGVSVEYIKDGIVLVWFGRNPSSKQRCLVDVGFFTRPMKYIDDVFLDKTNAYLYYIFITPPPVNDPNNIDILTRKNDTRKKFISKLAKLL